MADKFAFLDGADVIAFAHRGGTVEHPENTLEAFQSAVDLGYTYLETDVHASADGHLFAFHDDDLTRVAGVGSAIGDMTSSEIEAVRIDGYRVPRLDEIALSWPEARLNIDPKADGSLEPLVRTIRQLGMTDRVCIGSFSDRRIAWCRSELGSGLCTSMGPRETLRLWLLTRGITVRPPTGACAQLPTTHRVVGGWELDFTDPAFLDAAHQLGIGVHFWTINDEVEMANLIDLGADGIMTDRPDQLKAVMLDRNCWEPALV